jgi:hypothetical protein
MIRTSGFQRGFVIELQYIKNTSHPKEKKQISNLVHMSCFWNNQWRHTKEFLSVDSLKTYKIKFKKNSPWWEINFKIIFSQGGVYVYMV